MSRYKNLLYGIIGNRGNHDLFDMYSIQGYQRLCLINNARSSNNLLKIELEFSMQEVC